MRVIAYLLLVFLTACGATESELEGDWIVDEIVYKNDSLHVDSRTSKIILLPSGYKGDVLSFRLEDSIVLAPGINSYDLKLKWFFSGQVLNIVYDSALLCSQMLEQIARFKPIEPFYKMDESDKRQYDSFEIRYKKMADTLLLSEAFADLKRAARIYSGGYAVVSKTEKSLSLKSDNTWLFLTNLNYARNQRVEDLLRRNR